MKAGNAKGCLQDSQFPSSERLDTIFGAITAKGERKMTVAEIILCVHNANPDCEEFVFTTATKPALTKKNRTTKAPTDFTVEVQSKFKAKLGVNYQKAVNEQLEAQGKAADFIAQKPSGKHYVNGTNWLMESDTVPGKFYVALSGFSDRTTKYLVNGVEADQAKVDDLKANYLPKPSANKPLVEWRAYGIDSIVSVFPA